MGTVPDNLPQAAKDCLANRCKSACLDGGYLTCRTFLDGRVEHLDRKLDKLLESLEHSSTLPEDQLRFKETELIMIPAARRRIEAGSYGHCEDCTKPIAKERLERMPDANRCTACQNRSDRTT